MGTDPADQRSLSAAPGSATKLTGWPPISLPLDSDRIGPSGPAAGSARKARLRRPDANLPLGDHDVPVGELIGKASQQSSQRIDLGGCPFIVQT